MAARIGIDYTAAVQQAAGIGRYSRELVKALAALSPADSPQYRLFVASAGAVSLPALPGPNFDWRATRLTERWLARLWYRLRLPLWIQAWTGPLDLFHATDFFLPPVKPGTRTLVTVHDLSFVREPETTMPGMSRHLNRWVPYSVRQADHVIAVSEATRQDLIELYQTPPQKISVLYHGVTPDFQPVTEPDKLAGVRHKYGLGQQPFILSVGTIQPRKNYQRLIQAFAALDPALALVIVGSKGWHYEAIFNEVARCGLTGRVHFLGFAADADLPALYSAARLFVYPSLYEGFGLPALEAMACGTPIVASNQSALPEVVGEAGLLVDPCDVEALAAAMSRLLADTALRQQFALAGQARAAQFTWGEMAAQLLDLYQTLLGDKVRDLNHSNKFDPDDA
ncbi:MAG: glycosyltransferase family 4 protein [Anaerolineales bacterium]|nr:glycosyltransferase family 4 protein [Anaerolineales bacterium]